ncbi:zinc finger protein ush-like isoform X3 [Eriocheir sinensis]|uniref:zinc finger protein ush-like isoform X3 n=1 Tax=Eriocheir sinensis TaxID=95602 RepID=UPI0021C5E4AC|nr:zinc finger protein ush-like isoform X3 [Eriocheir sinensis]
MDLAAALSSLPWRTGAVSATFQQQIMMQKLIARLRHATGDDDWDSNEETSSNDLMTSPHSDQSAAGEGVTSSPVSSQPESGSAAEAGGGGGGGGGGGELTATTSPVDKDLKEATDTPARSLADRLSVSAGEKEGRGSPSPSPSPRGSPPPSPSQTASGAAASNTSATAASTKAVKSEQHPGGGASPGPKLSAEPPMKEEPAEHSPPAPSTPRAPQASPGLTPEMEAARQQLTSMIQGLPLLSMLPALHRLAPAAVVSLASSLGSISTNNSTSSVALGDATNGGSSSGSGTTNGRTTCVCGIRFSSPSNLEAHRMFYCTHRPNLHSDNESTSSKDHQASTTSLSPRGDGGTTTDEEEGGRVLRCPHCPYTTAHKLSLNGHMNIHTNPEDVAKTSSASHPPTATPQVTLTENRATDRYCSDCDIQFSSVKTFRVHKAHYCQTRHVLKGGGKSPAREESGPVAQANTLSGMVSAAAGSGQPILALPTNPILLVPYSLVAGAQLLPPHVLPQAGAAVVLPNGQVQPLSPGPLPGPAPPPLLSPTAAATHTPASAPPTSHPPQASPQSSPITPPKHSPKDDSRLKPVSSDVCGKRRGEGECPLDLTTKRPKLTIKTDLMSDEEKENREVNTPQARSPALKSRPGSSHGPAGEFEGKLLASPPQPSPSSEAEGQATPRSPRPSSAAPTLGSPRGLPDSPRPSTSTRSPNQPPQVPTVIPQLPPGFPNLLASLENLGGLSLASLQGLQGMPPELALKLLNSDLLMNGLAPLANPPVIVKQGEAKCNECNIVFYKEENLQVHKKHYCAARTVARGEDDHRSASNRSPAAATAGAGEGAAGPSRRSPSALPEVTSPPAAKASPSVKDTPKGNKPLLQFICTACGIKFTSPDNLKAHQTYYCPKREGASGEEGVTKGLWRCPRCRCAMPETLQAAHQCVTPSPAPSHGWKCPCCPAISPTAAAAQKHLETHAGIKGFRCTICGYRGNTLRGMRTHIRMHFEKRTNELQEENFISCILEDDDGSRRSAEMRTMADLPRVILENPTLSALLAEGAADCSEQPLSCHFCPFVTPYRTNLARHLAVAHKAGLDAKLTQDIQALIEGHVMNSAAEPPAASESEKHDPVENGNPVSSPPLPAIKLEPEVKLEVEEVEEKTRTPSVPLSPAEENSKAEATSNGGTAGTNGPDIPRYCKACNITFSYMESFLAHKRFYCTKPESTTPPETAVQ